MKDLEEELFADSLPKMEEKLKASKLPEDKAKLKKLQELRKRG